MPLFARIQFHVLILLPFLLAGAVGFVMFGCQQKSPEVKDATPTVTPDPLQTAHTAQINYEHMERMFSVQPVKDRLNQTTFIKV